jgi:hypothetical protein
VKTIILVQKNTFGDHLTLQSEMQERFIFEEDSFVAVNKN